MDVIFLSQTMLFRGISAEEIQGMLGCLGAEQKSYTKGETIYRAGECVQSMGMVLSGSVQIESDDPWGNKSILDRVPPGAVFAETYACVPDEPMMVSAVAAEKTEVVFLHAARLMHPCDTICPGHRRLSANLLRISAQKNLILSRRIFHTTPKTIRGRVVSYLSFQAAREGKTDFTIPFNRQQLADYLSVDRSALSNELSKMQKEGLLSVNKNRFSVKNTEILNE